MKKILLPLIILGIFLLPISPSFEMQKDGELALRVERNEIRAAYEDNFRATVVATGITAGSVDMSFTIKSTKDGAYFEYMKDKLGISGIGVMGVINYSPFRLELNREEDFSGFPRVYVPIWQILGYQTVGVLPSKNTIGTIQDTAGYAITINKTFGNLSVDTTYYARFVMEDVSGEPYVSISDTISFKTLKEGEGATPKEESDATNISIMNLHCTNLTNFTIEGCVASFMYTIYSLSAMVAHATGKFLDFLIFYSTNSDSYKNGFITKGWGAIRDVANIFFIIALLYIAIKMILSLGDSHSKKLISTIIIVALLINFSLFFTQVIIDGSNILAKVFYNNIDAKYENENPAIGAVGEKTISAGLVNKFNPQNIISQKIYDKNPGQFIFITFLALIITLYTAYIFFIIGFLFVGRVVMLWLSMIFAPIAFASYTLPFDIPGLGHKEWWKNLFENAFLAPIFIFMLYIIVMFAGFLSEIVKYPDGAGLMQSVMSIFIPFVILMVLLMKAKEMAIKYSGELGASMVKLGQMAGGLIVGAAAGAGALALRGTLGRAGTKLANSEWVKTHGAFGRGLQNIGSTLDKGSFDVRKTKLGAGVAKGSGMDFESAKMIGLGSKEGGYTKYREDKVKRRQERAKRLEVGEDEKLTQVVNKAEMDLQILLNQTTKEFERIDKGLVAARQKKADNANSPIGTAGYTAHNAAIAEIEALNTRKTNIKSGVAVGAIAGVSPAFGAVTVSGGVNAGKTIKQMENDVIPDAKNEKLTESRKRTTKYANEKALFGGKANKEAEHKIIMETKLDSGAKT